MKKFYEAPAADELYADAPAVMGDMLNASSGNDESGSDLDWDLL